MELWNATTVRNLIEENNGKLYDTFLNESRDWIMKVLTPIVVFVGVIGNAVTVVVLTRRRMRSSTNTYLTALAISDMIYLVGAFTLSLQHFKNSHTESFYSYWLYYRFGVWIVDSAGYVSTWLTVTFTIERYIAVCHPMKGKVMCTEYRAKIAIALIYTLCFLCTVSTLMEREIYVQKKKVNSEEIITYVSVKETELGNNKTYRKTFSWFGSITFVFIPLLLLGMFNSFLIMAVHKSKRDRRKMTQKDNASKTQKQENRITVILISVVILFIICQTPTAVFDTIERVHTAKEDSNLRKLSLILGNFFNFLVIINAASNFILYCALSARYRKTLVATFFKKSFGIHTPALSTNTLTEANTLIHGVPVPVIGKARSKSLNSVMRNKNGVLNKQLLAHKKSFH